MRKCYGLYGLDMPYRRISRRSATELAPLSGNSPEEEHSLGI